MESREGLQRQLATLNALVDRLVGDLGLAGIATVLGEVADLKGMLVSFNFEFVRKGGRIPFQRCLQRKPLEMTMV